jgi:sigma-54 dependent transcriptional regulator, acetoin dehydrogenase operon transcriptional activator AcoR
VVFLVHTVVPQARPDISRPDIASSWTRSRLYGLREEVAPRLVAREIDPEGLLVRAAGPVVRHAADELEGSPVAVILADPAARVVDIRFASEQIRRAVHGFGVVAGVRLGEDVIGTNALGTPIETRQGLLVRGRDHYTAALRGFTCYGHPIFHPITRRLEGVLGLGGLLDEGDRLPVPLARRMVRDIEDRLLTSSPRAQTALLRAFRMASARRRCVVVVGEGLVLASPAALDLLEASDHATLRACADGLATGGDRTHRVTLASGRRVRLACEPVDDTGGVLIDITPDTAFAPKSPGSEPDRQWPLAVIGDAGTGRTTAARQAAGAGPALLDAADIVLTGPRAWATDVSTALRGDGPAVIVENVDLLTGPMTALLARLLRTTPRRVVLTSTPGDHLDAAHAPLLTACRDRIDLIPLRRRRSDIPHLARQILGDISPHGRLRLTAETLRVLANQPWRGNVAELRGVLEGVAARRTAGDVIPSDLPATHRVVHAAASPLREAEREIIVAALDAAGGNKLQAARALGVSRSTLYNRIRALRIA